MNLPSEEIIVAAIQNKDEISLNYVLDKYGNLMKSIITKHLRLLPMYHEECFNDVLLAIWENISRYDKEKSSFKNWIAGIAKYKSIDYARKYMRDCTLKDIDTAYDILDVKAEHMLMELEVNAAFEELIENLNDKDKELFRRLYFHEQDIEKISTDMDLSTGVIYNRLSRGKKKLQLFLGGKDK